MIISGLELTARSANPLNCTADDPRNVVIDMSESHIWDASTVAALDAVTTKYHAKGKHVEIIGLNTDSADRHDRLSRMLGGG